MLVLFVNGLFINGYTLLLWFNLNCCTLLAPLKPVWVKTLPNPQTMIIQAVIIKVHKKPDERIGMSKREGTIKSGTDW